MKSFNKLIISPSNISYSVNHSLCNLQEKKKQQIINITFLTALIITCMYTVKVMVI